MESSLGISQLFRQLIHFGVDVLQLPCVSLGISEDIWGYLRISGDALDAGWAHKNSQVVGKRSKSFTMVHQISPLPAAEVSKLPTWFKSSRVSVFLPTWEIDGMSPSPCGNFLRGWNETETFQYQKTLKNIRNLSVSPNFCHQSCHVPSFTHQWPNFSYVDFIYHHLPIILGIWVSNSLDLVAQGVHFFVDRIDLRIHVATMAAMAAMAAIGPRRWLRCGLRLAHLGHRLEKHCDMTKSKLIL